MGIFSNPVSLHGMEHGRKSDKKAGGMPMIDAPGVAKRVEALRSFLNLGKGEFAQSFGLDPSSYSKVIDAKKPLKLDYGYSISMRWGVTMDYIYRGDLSKMDDPMRASIMASLNTPNE